MKKTETTLENHYSTCAIVQGGECDCKPKTTPDLALLRSALSRVLAASDWSRKMGLNNVGSDLSMAGTEIRKFILACPARKNDGENAHD